MARNLLLFDGLALLGVAVAGRPTWAALLGASAACWLVGVDPPDRIRSWALPLQPADDPTSAVVAVAVVMAGAAAHLFAPTGHRGDGC